MASSANRAAATTAGCAPCGTGAVARMAAVLVNVHQAQGPPLRILLGTVGVAAATCCDRRICPAVPVPVDMNSATVRDLIDILALSKEKAQRLASLRPIINRASLVEKKVLSEDELNRLLANGAVLKPVLNQKTNINKAELSQFIQTGIEEKLAKRLLTGRPYSSWQELDEYLACEDTSWQLLRKNFILSESSSS